MEHLSNDHEVHPTLHEIIINCTMKRDIRIEFERRAMETETKTWSDSPNGGKTTMEQILTSEE